MHFDRRSFLIAGSAGLSLAGCMGPTTANMAVSVQGHDLDPADDRILGV